MVSTASEPVAGLADHFNAAQLTEQVAEFLTSKSLSSSTSTARRSFMPTGAPES